MAETLKDLRNFISKVNIDLLNKEPIIKKQAFIKSKFYKFINGNFMNDLEKVIIKNKDKLTYDKLKSLFVKIDAKLKNLSDIYEKGSDKTSIGIENHIYLKKLKEIIDEFKEFKQSIRKNIFSVRKSDVYKDYQDYKKIGIQFFETTFESIRKNLKKVSQLKPAKCILENLKLKETIDIEGKSIDNLYDFLKIMLDCREKSKTERSTYYLDATKILGEKI